MIDINPTVSVITLNVNDLSIPIKDRNLNSRAKKKTPKNPQTYAVYNKTTLKTRLKGMENDISF